MGATSDKNALPDQISLREAWLFWFKLGWISFGGPAGQVAIMHAELVERRRWISERRFLHALNYCMVLPGPEAQQLATYLGSTGGVADPDALYSVWGGANDLLSLTDPATVPAVIGGAVAAEVGIVAALQQAGARYVLVANLPDIGLTPRARAGGAAGMAQGTAIATASTEKPIIDTGSGRASIRAVSAMPGVNWNAVARLTSQNSSSVTRGVVA